MNPAIALNIISEPTPLQTEAAATPIASSEYVTIQHRGTLKVGGDEYRLISRLPTARWGAGRLERDRLSANFQGDPLWPQFVLQKYPNLLRYFALTGNSDEQNCILPMTKTINRNLVELANSEFGFMDYADYPFDEVGKVSARTYVDTFIDRGRLPMAPLEDRDSIHDWSYHFITFLFPEYLESVRQNLLFIRGNLYRFAGEATHSWNYYGHAVDEHGQMRGHGVVETMAYSEAIYRQMAIALDVATAKFVQLMRLELKGKVEQCKAERAAVGVFLSGVSAASVRKILWMEKTLPFASELEDKPIQDPLVYIERRLALLEYKASIFPKDVSEESLFAGVLKALS